MQFDYTNNLQSFAICIHISLLFLFFSKMGNCQLEGLPIIKTYTKFDYHAGTQNWDIDQGKNGVIFFANNNGLLTYDGAKWLNYPLPNRTLTRSVEINSSGRIFVGGQNEIGYFEPNLLGKLEYHSILEVVPDEHKYFEDVWQIILLNDKVYWRASGKVFVWSKGKVNVYPQQNIVSIFLFEKTLFAQNEQGELIILNGKTIDSIINSHILEGSLITGHCITEDSSLLLSTEYNGIYRLKEDSVSIWIPNDSLFGKNIQVTSIDAAGNRRIAISTVQKGIYIVSEDRELIYNLNKEDGLLTNNVISIFLDRDQNIWIGQSNGISQVLISSPFTRILPQGDLEFAGYDVEVYDNKVYFATSVGLFSVPLEAGLRRLNHPSHLRMIEGSTGQTWGLDKIGNNLWLNHSNGLYIIEEHGAQSISGNIGNWLIKSDPKDSIKYILGSYKGIRMFDPTEDNLYPISDFEESSRFVEVQGGEIWVSHPYRGVYLINRDPEQTKISDFNTDNGLPSKLNNHVFKVKNEILITAEDGIYSYNRTLDSFFLHEIWNTIFPERNKIRRLFEMSTGDVWYITTSTIGKIDFKDRGLKIEYEKTEYPEIFSRLNGGWEKVYQADGKNVIIPVTSGFLHYNPLNDKKEHSPIHIQFSEVSIGTNYDSILFQGYFWEKDSICLTQPADLVPKIPYRLNSIKFSFNGTDLTRPEALLYRWRLEGFESGWSGWNSTKTKEYTLLNPGTYNFLVECRGEDGVVASGSYRFEVITPWYKSTLFNLFLSLLIIGIPILYLLRSRKKYSELQEEVLLTVKKSEEEKEAFVREKIISELEHKKRELISSTILLAQKQELSASIKAKLSGILSKAEKKDVRSEIRSTMRMIDQNKSMDENWKQIMYHFNELDKEFIDKLKTTYPNLNGKDLKICTYLRMNLATKEIASLMNVGVRSIEANRYRLRKKLNLKRNENLVDVILNL